MDLGCFNIRSLAHEGQNWLLYDQKFRQLRAKSQLPCGSLLAGFRLVIITLSYLILFEILHDSYNCLFLLLYVPSQQLWSLRDGQFT